MTTTVKQMVKTHLEANGFDGLVNVRGQCGCEVSDLMPCQEEQADCVAGHKGGCPGTDTIDDVKVGLCWCDGDCEWHMYEGPKPGPRT